MNKSVSLKCFFRAVLAIVVACVLSPVPVQSRPMSSEDVARMRWVAETAISPDGELMAYTVIVQRNPFVDENGGVWRELHVVDPEGNSRPFISAPVKVTNIQFTPDGSYISYLSERDDDNQKSLYVIATGGGESRKLLEFHSDIKDYAWAPDGRKIAFLATEKLSPVVDSLEETGFDQDVYEEDWRPVRIWIWDTADSSSSPRRLDLDGSAGDIYWSPDGKLLATTLAPTSLIDDSYTSRKVSLVNPESGEVVYKFDNPGKVGRIAFSPDSRQLAFVSVVNENDPKEGRLVVGPTKGGELKPLIWDYDGHVRRIVWTDNQTVAYLADKGVGSEIGSVKLDGTREAMQTTESPVFDDMKFSSDGSGIVYIGSAFDFPPEIFYAVKPGQNPVRLTNSNPWFTEIDFAPQEVITFLARDSLDLQGILIRPLNEQPGQKYPLILTVHGGPESRIDNGWNTWYSYPGQVAAGEDFAVFYPNYRGSTGRGVAFSKMGQADYAGGEFNDLVDAVDFLIGRGLVDSAHVGITGRSYGGYASAWAATALSDHFAATVMGAGVSDLVSKFGTTDIPQEMFLVHARRWPWDYWNWYRERSPIFHAENAHTPLLILHGKNDTRVHPSQSMELYRYLKTLGKVPVRLVFYEGEPHGTNKAAARYDANLRLMRWMRHYLKGPGGAPPPYRLDYGKLRSMGR